MAKLSPSHDFEEKQLKHESDPEVTPIEYSNGKTEVAPVEFNAIQGDAGMTGLQHSSESNYGEVAARGHAATDQ